MTTIFAIITLLLFIFQPYLDLRALKKVFGIALFLQLFYIIGHYMGGWPFPTPTVIVQILIVSGLGVALGVIFSKIWPIPSHKGFERIFRTFLVMVPSLGLGIGLQIILQGAQATQAIYLMFALAAWIGSGHFIRTDEAKKEKPIGSIFRRRNA
ncbi:hypothetical protein [Tenuibacillus multivorans]|uniref:Uncharacterized protein n=1 Tax=Tenuibacillus multivorans TaxID=237069 RepID=A0A1H0DT11_9BACI|nr:hypothetical protein [Tenuibacillus multivorans]GEL78819.1 hypothetical protein TMU01_30540 [Tenuibacillus multivorans]SDN73275.1 hypothetical protein SAMN05216498_2932 [Tenuibacillus multivorans]